MTARASWNVEGIDPAIRERAEQAAHRAGLSLADWMNSTIGQSVPDVRAAPGVVDIHHRLDSITRQIEQLSQPSAPRGGTNGVAHQLNDAISRLDARLSQISVTPPAPAPAPAPAQSYAPPPQPVRHPPHQQPDRVERAAHQVYRASPPTAPGMLDFDISEITARQSELDGAPLRPLPRSISPPLAAPMPDLSGLEQQIQNLTGQIEQLRRPDGIDQSISAFRAELADMRRTITEAMPRHAIESLENEIRSLARRIDEGRQSGGDGNALSHVERALADIHTTLRALTPAEHLAGFDDAIRNLGGKIDLIVRSSPDHGAVQQLQGAIAALKGIVSNVASNEALERLSDDVQTLSSKVDQLSRNEAYGGSLAALEQKIATLTSALETRERPAEQDQSQIETAVRGLSDRIDQLQVGNDGAAALAHLEQRISVMLERLDMTDHRPPNLGRVEDGLSDILRQLGEQRSHFMALSEARPAIAPPPMDRELVDAIKRELADMRFSQSETDRHTQDSLEIVHNTLGHVVDRLAMIEGDLRQPRIEPQPMMQASAPLPAAVAPIAAPAPPMPVATLLPRPEMPNPAQSETFASVRKILLQDEPPALAATPSLQDILISAREPDAVLAARAPQPASMPQSQPIDSGLPPDHPLEPGTRPQSRPSTPSERIAASESALGVVPDASREAANTSSFIAAARRAAQAAAAATSPEKQARISVLGDAKRATAKTPEGPSTIKSKIRSLLVGASVVIIVLGSFRFAMSLLDGGGEAAHAQLPAADKPTITAPAPAEPSRAKPDPAPSMTAPAPLDRQSLMTFPPQETPTRIASAGSNADITGSITTPPAPAVIVPAPPSTTGSRTPALMPVLDKLPDGIGGPMLRAAALRGEPGAAYEIATRYAEGKGVSTNTDEAAKWYDRAAQAGLVPAMFRLGAFYEKGISFKKDADAAKRYYILAAERGHAKAMHNLAVLDADGGARGPNYKNAAQWFRKAADRGVADSQFNLGILYARGIGVEQNLAESYKWFSLAAAQGDADSGRKRDDVAKRLDAQSLAAAKLAIQTFLPEPQPADAINVAAPAGGWDAAASTPAPAGAAVKKPGKMPAPKQSASAR